MFVRFLLLLLLLANSALLSSCATSSSINESRNVAGAEVDCTIKDKNEIYKTVKIRPKSAKEDHEKHLETDYFTPEVREQHRFIVFEGVVYNNNCEIMQNGEDQTKLNYVMDAFGNFYWFNEKVNKRTRHSAVFSGGPVAGAGNIEIDGGQIKAIDTDSGHYPSGRVFENVLKELEDSGIDLNKVNVVHSDND
jgi:hypothetical protein